MVQEYWNIAKLIVEEEQTEKIGQFMEMNKVKGLTAVIYDICESITIYLQNSTQCVENYYGNCMYKEILSHFINEVK